MQDFEKGVPERLVLSGEGLRQMTSGQYTTLLKNLGRMGIEAHPTNSEHEEISAELLDTDKVSEKTLLEFAEANGYDESLVVRLWNSLARSYWGKKDEIEKRDRGESYDRFELRNPIEFVESEDGSRTITMSSLESTIQWLLNDVRDGHYIPIRNFGDRSLSFLAHYVNETLKPEEPYQAKYSPDYVDELAPEVIPPAEDYEVDSESPLLETINIDGEDIKVVSAKAIRGVCKTIGIKPNRASHLRFVFDEVAEALVGDVPDVKRQDKPKLVSDGLVYLKTKPSSGYYSDPDIIEWGVSPDKFVDLMRDYQDGKLELKSMTRLMNFMVTNYIVAIQSVASTDAQSEKG